MKDSHGQFVHKRLPQRRLNLIDSTISSHFTILNSEERMKLIKKANEVASVIADIEIDRAKKREENNWRSCRTEVKRSQQKLAKAPESSWQKMFLYSSEFFDTLIENSS